MKVKRAFTPAPWEFSDSSVMGGTPPKKAQHAWKNTVCSLSKLDMVTGLQSEKEYQANGKLIAQAPDMFEFIVSVYDQLDDETKAEAEQLLKL